MVVESAALKADHLEAKMVEKKDALWVETKAA